MEVKMKAYNEKLDSLFTQWRKALGERREVPDESGALHFTRDGLVRKPTSIGLDVDALWDLDDIRVMFLIKDQPSAWDDDLRDWLCADNENARANCELRPRFIRNIANIFYGLHHGGVPYSKVRDRYESVRECFLKHPFALVECKKEPGGTTLADSVLRENLALSGDFLLREMDILVPLDPPKGTRQMIVCTSPVIYGFVLGRYPEGSLESFGEGHNSIRYFQDGDTLIFCSYHPSAYGKSYETVYEGVMDHYRAFLMKYGDRANMDM